MSGGYRFRAYGLTFESDIPFAHFEEADFRGKADVSIRLGEVMGPSHPPPPRMIVESSPGRILIRGARSAAVLVSGGCRITVEPLPKGDPAVIRQLILGWALGGIFHQRGMLPLHACALTGGRGCLVFCAGSGTGKSTLAAAFLNRGFAYLDDNVALVNFRPEGPCVVPGAPELRLWDKGFSALDFEHRIAGPLRPGGRKFSVIARERFHPKEEPIRRIVVLRRAPGSGLTVAPLSGRAKFGSLMEHVFGLRLINDLEGRGRLFDMVRRLADGTALSEIRLPAPRPSPEDLCRLILARGLDDNEGAGGSGREEGG